MRIAIASDHAGFHLKEAIKQQLADSPHAVVDFGTHDDSPVDYPDFAAPVAYAVAAGSFDRGILCCGSGLGMSMAANKVAAVRAAAAWNVETARLAREHNDANILALGARLIPPAEAAAMVSVFLDTPFAGGRHQRRLDKLAAVRAGQPS